MYRKLTLLFTMLMVFVSTGCQDLEKNNYTFYGTLEMEQINISAETSGILKEVMVSEGDSINKNTVIAALNAPESSIKAEQAELGIQTAKNELQRVNEGAREEEIAAQRAVVKQMGAQANASDAALKQAEIALKQADINANNAIETYHFKKKIYDDTLELYKAETISRQELDLAEYNMNIAKNTYENAVKASEGAKAQLEIQQTQKESMKQQLEAANQKLLILVNGAMDTSKTAAALGIKQAETNYELTQLALGKREIKSEIDGVIDTINYGVGEYVQQGSPIATVSNPKNLWVKIYVPERFLPQIKLQQEVWLSTKYISDKITGTITNISSEAEYTPMNIITEDDRERLLYAVKVQIAEPAEKLKAGMLLDVHFE